MAMKYAGATFHFCPPPDLSESAELSGRQETVVFTIKEAAKILRLDPRTVRRMVASGELAGGRRGHAIRISVGSVLAWMAGGTPPKGKGE